MEKVASGFRLENKTHEQFNRWLHNLPILIKVSEKEKLWEECEGKRGILWIEISGFSLY